MRLSQVAAGRALLALAIVAGSLRADPGDVESSRDYPGWTRPPGLVISDYDEDNPAYFDFPISRPTSLDADHIDAVRVRGHRYVIRYELAPGAHARSVYQTQEYYEKLAAAQGFTLQKDGGVGDVSETFCKTSDREALWVYLQPSVGANVLTVVESKTPAPPPPQNLPALAVTPVKLAPPPPPAELNPMTTDIATLKRASTPAPPRYMISDDASPGSVAAGSEPLPAEPALVAATPVPAAPPPQRDLTSPGAPTPTLHAKIPRQVPPPSPPSSPVIAVSFPDTDAMPPADEPALPRDQSTPVVQDDSLYQSLSADGRVIVPFVFAPGKSDVGDSSQPLIDRIVAMMHAHPGLQLRIEGHTDNSGDSNANMRLSAERAMAIEQKLIDADIDRKRLDAVGVGGLQPLADNSTAEGREKNRRIELVMWQKYPTFHAAAPNGKNYYPTADSGNGGL